MYISANNKELVHETELSSEPSHQRRCLRSMLATSLLFCRANTSTLLFSGDCLAFHGRLGYTARMRGEHAKKVARDVIEFLSEPRFVAAWAKKEILRIGKA